MMRSMFSGVSGLRNHQIRMDTIGNNISNVNTVGFKKSRVIFQDILSQSIRGASSPQGGRGGTNPQQVGLGITVNSIDSIHTQGSSETTGKVTDMMVDGDGFFIIGDGTNRFYTRAGNFDFDAEGNLVNANGLKVQGWMPNTSGVIDTTVAVTSIAIPKGQSLQPKATTVATYINNLDSNTPIDPAANDTYTTSLEVYDSLGNQYAIPIIFHHTLANTWAVILSGTLPPGVATQTLSGTTLTFNANGTFNSMTAGGGDLDLTFSNGASAASIQLTFSAMTQFASPSTARYNTQDGYASGVLNGYAIDKAGVITGRFSNGLTKQMAQVAVANFNNPGGLTKAGENLYNSSNNSGSAQIGTAGTGGRGDISPGKLEMSNVDLSQEFTDMIITQRGFQANSRIITVSDEMLQELVNLKR